MPSSGGSSWPCDSCDSCFVSGLYPWATSEAPWDSCCCCCQVASVMSDSVRPHRWPAHQVPLSLGFSTESSFSPTPQALAGSRTHFCPTAAAREQGKRVLHPSTTPSPILSGTCKKRRLSCPIRQFEYDFVFLLVEKNIILLCIYIYIYIISYLGKDEVQVNVLSLEDD